MNTATAAEDKPSLLKPFASFAAPLGRAMIASLFVVSAAGKVAAIEGSKGYMEAMGVPGALLPAVIAFELLVPLALVAGFRARLAAFLLAGFSVVTAFVFHGDVADQIQQIMFLKNIAIAGGLLLVVANGPGAFSLDARR